jgi:hypothetical protein
MGMDLEHGENSGQNVEGNIRKEAHTPPNFDVALQKKSMCDTQRDLEEEKLFKELQ